MPARRTSEANVRTPEREGKPATGHLGLRRVAVPVEGSLRPPASRGSPAAFHVRAKPSRRRVTHVVTNPQPGTSGCDGSPASSQSSSVATETLAGRPGGEAGPAGTLARAGGRGNSADRRLAHPGSPSLVLLACRRQVYLVPVTAALAVVGLIGRLGSRTVPLAAARSATPPRQPRPLPLSTLVCCGRWPMEQPVRSPFVAPCRVFQSPGTDHKPPRENRIRDHHPTCSRRRNRELLGDKVGEVDGSNLAVIPVPKLVKKLFFQPQPILGFP